MCGRTTTVGSFSRDVWTTTCVEFLKTFKAVCNVRLAVDEDVHGLNEVLDGSSHKIKLFLGHSVRCHVQQLVFYEVRNDENCGSIWWNVNDISKAVVLSAGVVLDFYFLDHFPTVRVLIILFFLHYFFQSIVIHTRYNFRHRVHTVVHVSSPHAFPFILHHPRLLFPLLHSSPLLF